MRPRTATSRKTKQTIKPKDVAAIRSMLRHRVHPDIIADIFGIDKTMVRKMRQNHAA